MENLLFLFLFLFFYILGSIPTGLFIGKLAQQKDLRNTGSGNIGATNALRVLGKKWGILVFLLDFCKGFVPLTICLHFSKFWITEPSTKTFLQPNPTIKISLLAISPILGHMFSLFNKFKGGKAIATSVGIITAFNPLIGISGIIFFAIFLRLFGYASLASIIASTLVNVFLWLNYLYCGNFGTLGPIKNQIPKTELFYFSINFATLVIIAKHYSNILRLINGTENKFNFKKEK
ncbi:MAG: glycerol-3-phosphate acyltransferase [Candidatus Phytoplasma asteris]|uniref:Glycerol-3-phosphate acyltransferase n=1 Tax=Onion yellows phytoplasma OY-W TaxID=428984 RepID=K7ZQ11_ONYPH|nr:MAG: glycerol-3-phosphate acyltransferase [Periwinkle leaf yellowing phytoplasma]WEX19797.1 MAG: glycerol-3-phosphate acyltransferase [Candidatus Phytoplasma asteris]BAM66619.1 glycerol-3-phosphate acyltransferase [Onion yellows phytoplasma OY-W]